MNYLAGTIDIPDCAKPYHFEPVLLTGGLVGLLMLCVTFLVWKKL